MKKCILFFLVSFLSIPAISQQDSRLLRFPDIRQNQIVFVFAGDIWTVASSGGIARQLTSHEGQELHPKISPDGNWIAFSAEYSGTRQVYIMPSEGGKPTQLTYYNDVGIMPPRGGFDYQILGWTPDSKRVLFRGNRTPWGERMGRYFTISIAGGLEMPLPIPEGGSGELSPDGSKMVYTPIEREWRTWKRTRGGRAQDVWIFDLKNISSERITENPMTDNMPMWIGNTIYFTSDREHTLNLYSYDLTTKQTKKVTNHSEYDVLWPSSGPGTIIYQCGGWLYVYNTVTNVSERVPIKIYSEGKQALIAFKDVSKNISSFGLSPSGKRALFEARGEIFTVPEKYGEIQNITCTQGIREMDPTWSPDGKTIAYYSDVSGEYELYIRNADRSGTPTQVTKDSKTWPFAPVWSPDGKKIAFGDKRQMLRWIDIESGKVTDIEKGIRSDITYYAWSPDSRWITFTNGTPTDQTGIFVYSIEGDTVSQLSSGYSNDYNPVFSTDGKYMFFISNRDFNLSFSKYEFTYIYTNAARVFVAALTNDTPVIAPFRSDEEKGIDASKYEKKSVEKDSDENKKVTRPPHVVIEVEGFPERVMALPGASADYSSLNVTKDAVLYIRDDKGGRNLYRYNIETQIEEKVLEKISSYDLSANGEKIIFFSGGTYGICENKPGQKTTDGTLDLKGMEVKLEPKQEWAEIFTDAWRQMRDWFYDPNMHGVDWNAMRVRYGQLIPFLERRSDLDFLLGELVGELSAGHTYVNAGDEPRVARREGGMLGCEFTDSGESFYQIAKIFRGENWNKAFRSPLTEPGMNVREGAYLIAINGAEVHTTDNPYRFLENMEGKTVTVTLNSEPSRDGARDLTIEPVASEHDLFFLDWIRRNREYVDSASRGRIGYIWIPNTAVEGNRELFKWFYPQANKEALIIDDRYNGGGFIPYNMISLLDREALNYWARRGVEPFTAPDVFHNGPKACLINGYSSSGGDAFPYYFRKKGLGKIIGTRTWGGLIGLSGNPEFMDGGSLSIPTFRFYDTDGKWAIENEGVSPDIEVIDQPDLVAKGIDPSLIKAIEVLMEELRANPPKDPVVPTPPDESK